MNFNLSHAHAPLSIPPQQALCASSNNQQPLLGGLVAAALKLERPIEPFINGLREGGGVHGNSLSPRCNPSRG